MLSGRIFEPIKYSIMPLMHAALTDPEYGFDVVDEAGHSLRIDVPVEQGGGGTGFRPMQTILAALCGCSGVDIVSILRKQRQNMRGLEILVDGEREKDKEPSLWESLHVTFLITGEVEPGKAWRAVELSINKYCSVAETLRRAGARITWSVSVNGQEVQTN
jgi:putative redox protein